MLLSSGIYGKLLLVLFVGMLAWTYQVIQPPPPKLCGSPDGPPVTGPRIKLRDGRYLAYKEHGMPRAIAKHKIVFIHGFKNSRHNAVCAITLSPEMAEELGVYVVSFDRPGYGESDPDPKRAQKSIALDIEELAVQLDLGSKFYVMGFSMGGQVVWTCLKYIPHRLAGAALLAPVANFWWPKLPANVSRKAYNMQLPQDQWAVRVAHYAPWLTYWWNTQKLFPSSSVIEGSTVNMAQVDREILSKLPMLKDLTSYAKQQGEHESLHRDMNIAFGMWDFDPLDLENPFPNNEGSVHLWHGDEDTIVPVLLQRSVAEQLPWIQYHELKGEGHLFPLAGGMCNEILKRLVAGHN